MEKNLGHATAYGYAKSKGYSGTEDEFAQLMADYASVGQSAAQSAEQAAASATSASGSAATATQAAQTATGKASEATTAADTATTKALEASQSASTASAAATSAGTSAQTATTAATTATTKASEASESAATATTAKTDAETARDAAAQSASEAAASAASIDPDEFDRKIYAAFATDIASGSIVSFDDGADNIPMKDVLVHIEPVQDLYGQSNPYPAGGGKNLLNPTTSTGSAITWGGVTFSTSEDTITLSGTGIYSGGRTALTLKTIHLAAGTYYISASASSGTLPQIVTQSVSNGTYTVLVDRQPISFTLSEDTDIVVGFNILNDKTYDTTFKLQVESGTIATDYAPYSNICPISGWTGANVQRTGANVWDEEWEVGAYNRTTGDKAIDSSKFRCANYIPVVPNTAYYIGSSVNATWIVLYYSADKQYLRKYETFTNSTFTTPSNCNYVTFYGATSFYGTTYNHDISINYPSVDTDYHPYAGNTYPVTFPTEAGTIYGAYVDVTGGELVVDRAYGVLNNPDKWFETSETVNFRYSVPFDSRKIYDDSYSGLTCSYVPCLYGAEPYGRWNSASGTYFCIKSSTLTLDQVKADAEAGKISIVYELAEPIHYPLAPIEIKTLLGQNNIWADTGDTEVEYRADTTLYIKRLTESDTDMVADSNIVSGQYFMVGTDLYKATVNIASGASVIVGTNATKVSLATALNEINQ